MKIILNILVIGLFLIGIAQGISLPHIELSGHQSEEGVLRVHLQNPSSTQWMAILSWTTPLTIDGASTRLRVVDKSTEQEVPYHGPVIKRSSTLSSSSESVVLLAPAASYEATLDLKTGYRFEAGHQYQVSLLQDATVSMFYFDSQSESRRDDAEFQAKLSDVSSYEQYSFVSSSSSSSTAKDVEEGKMVSFVSSNTNEYPYERNLKIARTARADSAVNCGTADQNTLVTDAIDLSRTMSANAASYAVQGCVDSSYVTWFGVYDATRYNTFKNCITGVRDYLALDYGSSWTTDCSYVGCSPDTVAYVYIGDPTHTIYLCSAYWSMADSWTYDSKAGTLIHEMSHLVCENADHAYGTTKCQNLAINTPNKAVKNADSYEFFSESDPVCSTQSSTSTTGTGTTTSTTTTTTSSSSSSSSGCLAADSRVNTLNSQSGQILSKSLSELQIGDLVASVDDAMNQVFSPVYYIFHKEEEENLVPILQIETLSGHTLRLTAQHLVPSLAAKMNPNNQASHWETVRADSLATGDWLLVQQQNQVVPARVKSVSASAAPILHPVTENHRIIVDGVVSSVHAYSEALYKPLLAPLRLAYTYSPSLLQAPVVKGFLSFMVQISDLFESASFNSLIEITSY